MSRFAYLKGVDPEEVLGNVKDVVEVGVKLRKKKKAKELRVPVKSKKTSRKRSK